MEQHLPRCHRHLQTREENGSAGVRRARTRRRRHFVRPLSSLPPPGPRGAAGPCTPPRPPSLPLARLPARAPAAARLRLPREPASEEMAVTTRASHLRQPEENAGGLDELAAQDAQVRLAGQVEAVLHGRGRREPLLRNQRVVDG